MGKTSMKAILGLLLVIVVAIMGAMGYVRSQGDNSKFAASGEQLFIVKEGMTTVEIAQLLHERKLVANPKAFGWEARLKGLAERLQAGPYKLMGGMSNSQIVEVMAKGIIKEARFTVPEGFTVVKTAKKLEEEGLGSAEKFLAAAKNYAPYPYMATEDPNVVFKCEGFIYPATYDFAVGASEEKLLKIMVDQFQQEVVTNKLEEKAKAKNMSLRDVVNLAAMVELEAMYREELARIAGVFVKRLEIGMPIQSDTTIQYILGAQKEIITFKDTEIANPYNTYQNPGLPPGPIGSPSLAAMEAVLNPESHEFLYFVAEKDGHHRFTKTYREHLNAINQIDGGN